MDYAVIDVETTGLFPEHHDRIVEIAGIRLGPGFTAASEFVTLVNPERDIGPTRIHGIRSRDVLDAPKFPDIAGSVIELLRGAIVVGHNVNFDLRFLRAEFAREGMQMPPAPYVDTMSLSIQAGAPTRRLEDACRFMGIGLSGHHAALNDARATSDLFIQCIEHFGTRRLDNWLKNPCDPKALAWPRATTRGSPLPRKAAARKAEAEETLISTIARQLPASSATPGEWQAYYAVLDRALEDRRITDDEADALRQAALEAGMSRADLQKANRAYVRDVIRVANRDRVISDFEMADIRQVAKLLQIDDEVDQLLAEVEDSAEPASDVASKTRLEGRTVCFTGALNAIIEGQQATRKTASAAATEHGMTVVKNVTKSLDYLVAADPDSMSGKAKKARQYGIRIIAEPVFWALMCVDTD